MYLKLTILLPNWAVDRKKMEVTFVGNFQKIVHTISLPNISLVDRMSKVCWQMQHLKNFNKTKTKLYKSLKSMKLLKNCTKETLI